MEGRSPEESWETICLVQKMQDYIKLHAREEEFSVKEIYDAVGYSSRHCERVFKRLVGKSIGEYIKLIHLSESAQSLILQDSSVIDIALNSGFSSHEGYCRAFHKQFGIAPSIYRQEHMAIPLFIQYPVQSYYTYLYQKESLKMSKDTKVCMVTIVKRPARKLLMLRAKQAHDYWSYCEEMGCGWEGLFNSIPEKMDTAAILELPYPLKKSGYAGIAAGVEVPIEYQAVLPQGVECVELLECEMMYFQSEPFEREEEFGAAIDCVLHATKQYSVNSYGYEYAFDLAPKFNFGASTQMGAKMALPVRKVVK